MKKYPEFQPVEKCHRAVFNKMFREDVPEISEFTFSNIYAWRDVYKTSVSELEGMLILKTGMGEKSEFLSPIGQGEKKKVILRVFEENNCVFDRVPEKVAGMFMDDERFRVAPRAEHSDYLYKTEDLVSLKGKKYDGKRNLIKNFRNKYRYRYVKLSPGNIDGYYALEHAWCDIKGCDEVEGLGNERKAARELVKNFSEFELLGGALEVGDVFKAVIIAESLNPGTLVVHVFKADLEMKGAYQTLLNEFLMNEAAGIESINLEQDLGVGGIRKAKLSYHPFGMIKKFSIEKI